MKSNSITPKLPLPKPIDHSLSLMNVDSIKRSVLGPTSQFREMESNRAKRSVILYNSASRDARNIPLIESEEDLIRRRRKYIEENHTEWELIKKKRLEADTMLTMIYGEDHGCRYRNLMTAIEIYLVCGYQDLLDPMVVLDIRRYAMPSNWSPVEWTSEIDAIKAKFKHDPNPYASQPKIESKILKWIAKQKPVKPSVEKKIIEDMVFLACCVLVPAYETYMLRDDGSGADASDREGLREFLGPGDLLREIDGSCAIQPTKPIGYWSVKQMMERMFKGISLNENTTGITPAEKSSGSLKKRTASEMLSEPPLQFAYVSSNTGAAAQMYVHNYPPHSHKDDPRTMQSEDDVTLTVESLVNEVRRTYPVETLAMVPHLRKIIEENRRVAEEEERRSWK